MAQDASEGWQHRLPTVKLQAEFFLLKFPDVGRDHVMEMAEDFKKQDSRKKGELQEDQALRLFEIRKETKRYVELRKMVKDLVYDSRREFSFLEWSCIAYNKSWKELHAAGANQAEIDAAIARIREAEEKQERVEQEERRRKENIARQEAKDKQDREEQTGRAGVLGAASKFDWAGKDSKDTTQTNAERIKAEAAARKQTKDAIAAKKQAEEDKIRAEKNSAEEMKRKQEEMKRKSEEDDRIAAEKEAERKARVQAALRKQFGGST